MRKFQVSVILLITIVLFIHCEKKKPGAIKQESIPLATKTIRNRVNLKKAKAFKNSTGKQVYFSTYNISKERTATKSSPKAGLANKGFNLVNSIETFNLVSTVEQPHSMAEFAGLDNIFNQYYQSNDPPKYNPTANYSEQAASLNTAFDPCQDWSDFKENYYIDDAIGGNYTHLAVHVKTFNQGESDLSRNTFGNIPESEFNETINTIQAKINEYRTGLRAWFDAKYSYKRWKSCMDARCPSRDSTCIANANENCGTEPIIPAKPEPVSGGGVPEKGACKEKLFAQPYNIDAQTYTFPRKANRIDGYGTLQVGPLTFTTAGTGADFSRIYLTIRKPVSGENNALSVSVVSSDSQGLERNIVVVLQTNGNSITTKWSELESAISTDATASSLVTISATGDTNTEVSELPKTYLAGAWEATGDYFVDYNNLPADEFKNVVLCVQNAQYVRTYGPSEKSHDWNLGRWQELEYEVIPDAEVVEVWPDGVPKVPLYALDALDRRHVEPIVDSYGNVIVPAGCQVENVRYFPGETCYSFCDNSVKVSKSCYYNVAPTTADPDGILDSELNDRKRAIMSSDIIEGTNVRRDGGLLYMSIKGPEDKIFNVRVMHNLHKSHILGEGNIDDGIERSENSFTFNIPFCPAFDIPYEYKICNVPKAEHYRFGTKIENTINTGIPNCFVDAAKTWVVSNIRVADDRVGSPTWQEMSYVVNGREYYPWDKSYQLLEKTEFVLKKDLLNNQDGILVKGTSFTNMCIDDTTDSEGNVSQAQSAYRCANQQDGATTPDNVCNTTNSPRGIRFLEEDDGNYVRFIYTTFDEQKEERKELFLYVDTNDNPEHWNHDGWRDANEDLVSEDFKMKPASMTDSKFKQCFLTGEQDQNGNDILNPSVIRSNYSPLIINVNHSTSVALSGLEKDLFFIGRRYNTAISTRRSNYTKYETKKITPAGSIGTMGINREVITRAFVKTGWIDGAVGDALLVYDLNNNGKIDSGFELFGEATIVEESRHYGPFGYIEAGTFAPNGFVALAQYDVNKDGKIDAADPIFNKLMFWQDGRGGVANAQVDTGELRSLAELRITSFNVNKIMEMEDTDKYGNKTLLRSTYTYLRDNTIFENMIFDVYFVYKDLTDAERGDEKILTTDELPKYNLLNDQIDAANNFHRTLEEAVMRQLEQ